MSDPIFGISITQIDDQPRPAVVTDMSIIGLVGTAPLADGVAYPFNDPVLVFSDDAVALKALGLTGSLPGQIDLINAQLGDFQVAAQIVIVRVDAGAAEADTITNLVGSTTLKTGVNALRLAGPKLGVVPRLIGVPGFTHQQLNGLSRVDVTTPGTGYTTAPAVAFTGGGGTGASGHATILGGAVTAVIIDNPGINYTTAPTVGLTGGAGAGAVATAVLDVMENAVVAALPAVCSALLAHAVVSGPHTTLQGFTDWRKTIKSQRIIPLETWAKVGVAATVTDSVGSILGIAVRRDHEFNGRPFHSWANQAVAGIVGPSRPIEFSLTDGATEAQQILLQNGGVIVRGEMGVEGAISNGGFVYIGTDNCADDPLWQFYNISRGRDYIHLIFLKTLRTYLGRFNINGQTIQAVINTMTLALRGLEADGDILGSQVSFTRSLNSPENLRLGKFVVNFAAEEAPVLRYLGIRSARYRPALDTLLNNLQAQLDAAA